MNYRIDIQNASSKALPLTDDALTHMACLALHNRKDKAELTLRLVEPQEMVSLNHQYRGKNKVTNVLAFPSALPDVVQLKHPFLGDIIICPAVLQEESVQLNKTLQAHWALIVIHGVLHLLGYDHITDSDAQCMQKIEVELLAELGYENPYDVEDTRLE